MSYLIIIMNTYNVFSHVLVLNQTRNSIFAVKSFEEGEPLTHDYMCDIYTL